MHISVMTQMAAICLGAAALVGRAALAQALALTHVHVLADQRFLADEPLLSEILCVGATLRSRTCHFKDLFFNIDTGRFHVYTDTGTAASMGWVDGKKVDTATDAAGDPYLQLGLCVPT